MNIFSSLIKLLLHPNQTQGKHG